MSTGRSGITVGEVLTASTRYWYILMMAMVVCGGVAFVLSQASPGTYTAIATTKVTHSNGISPELESRIETELSAKIQKNNDSSLTIRSTTQTPESASQNIRSTLDLLSSLPALSDEDRSIYQELLDTLQVRREAIQNSYKSLNSGAEAFTTQRFEELFQLEDKLALRIRDIENALSAQSYLLPSTVRQTTISSAPSLRNTLFAGAAMGLLLGIIAAGFLNTRRISKRI